MCIKSVVMNCSISRLVRREQLPQCVIVFDRGRIQAVAHVKVGCNGLDLADVAEDGIELAGETVQLAVGQGESGQPRQVRNLVSGDLGHDHEA